MTWMNDPKTKQQSVSLTLVCASFAIAAIAMGLEVANVTKTTSGSFELFFTCCGLYWSRKYQSSKGAILEVNDTTKGQ